MNDFYTEQLVKRNATPGSIMAKAGLLVLTIVAGAAIFLFLPFGVPLIALLIVLDVVFFKRLNVEYEYMYINGDLDIDKIMGQEKRKNIFECSIADLEIIAPSGSAELRGYGDVKTVNYSTMTKGNKTYEMIIVKDNTKTKVIFEPNEAILNGMKMLAPRKVII